MENVNSAVLKMKTGACKSLQTGEHINSDDALNIPQPAAILFPNDPYMDAV
jgi:hypothetical protein